jgi:hypothetical protein
MQLRQYSYNAVSSSIHFFIFFFFYRGNLVIDDEARGVSLFLGGVK